MKQLNQEFMSYDVDLNIENYRRDVLNMFQTMALLLDQLCHVKGEFTYLDLYIPTIIFFIEHGVNFMTYLNYEMLDQCVSLK